LGYDGREIKKRLAFEPAVETGDVVLAAPEMLARVRLQEEKGSQKKSSATGALQREKSTFA
jgi:hypothetical protein